MPDPKRIDAHQHFWNFDPIEYPWIGADMPALRRDCLPDTFAVELSRERLDACVAVQARCTNAETEYLLALASQSDWIAGVVGWVDVRADSLANTLDGWDCHSRLSGFRHLIQDEPKPEEYLRDRRFRQGLRLLQSRGYTFDILVRAPHLAAACKLCAACDGHWLVLDHLGKPAIRAGDLDTWRRQIEPLRHLPHVLIKLSGLVTEATLRSTVDATEIRPYLDAALEMFGPSRLMFGSDWPVCLLSASYAHVCRLIADWSRALSDSEQQTLWGGTAARAYDLSFAPNSIGHA
jgi:L-fuconolactonase